MVSIKTKLVTGITALVIVILGIAAVLLMQQKEREMTADLFETTNTFGELTADEVVKDYNLYLSENSFVYFNREIQKLFQRNSDVEFVKVMNYGGEVLYDSNSERDKQYDGPVRVVFAGDSGRVQSQYASVRTLGDRVVYLDRNDSGTIRYVDQNGNSVESLGGLERVHSFMFPVDNAYAVEYGVSYEHLDESIAKMRNNIILLAVFAMMLGIALAWFVAGRIVGPLAVMSAGAKQIGAGDLQTRIPVDTNDEVGALAATFNQMAEALEVSTRSLIDKERISKELELAAQIQKDILPKKLPVVKGLDISAGLIPAEEVGGDCYDFIPLGGGKWIFYLGDVTGHGVPSGIVVSIANAMFFRSSDQDDPKEILVDVNRVLKAKTTANMFLTLLLLHWDEEKGVMKYVSAGHDPMLHYKASDGSVNVCSHGGIALGMLPEIGAQLQEQEVKLESGDFLVLYTDGVPEAWRNEQEMYGMERLKNIVGQCGDLERASAIRNAVFADVKEFAGNYKQMDDITVMVVKRR